MRERRAMHTHKRRNSKNIFLNEIHTICILQQKIELCCLCVVSVAMHKLKRLYGMSVYGGMGLCKHPLQTTHNECYRSVQLHTMANSTDVEKKRSQQEGTMDDRQNYDEFQMS